MNGPRLASIIGALAIVAVLVVVIAGGSSDGSGDGGAASRERVSLLLDFFPNADHAGIYAAQAGGHFSDEGVRVSIRTPSDPAAPLKLLAAGKVDLAITYEPELLLARDQNLPVVSVAALVQQPLTSIVSIGAKHITSVADLRGKRVALDEPGSGTLVDARMVLAAYGLKETDIKPEYIKPNQAGDKLKDGSLDGFFFVGGAPAGAIAELASSGAGIELVPLGGPQAQALLKSSPWFSVHHIDAGTYKDVGAVDTLAVSAQLVTSAKIPTETVYEITKAMYSDAAQKALQAGHAKGKFITRQNAVEGAGIPFHPGAEKFYKEAGLLK